MAPTSNVKLGQHSGTVTKLVTISNVRWKTADEPRSGTKSRYAGCTSSYWVQGPIGDMQEAQGSLQAPLRLGL